MSLSQKPKASPNRISPARRAAFGILQRVESEDAYASSLLVALDQELRADDRALCHVLVLGVLRQRLWLDSAIQHFANRQVDNLDLAVKLALRMGLYQLRFLTRIPPSAAVNESVALVRTAGLKSAASFVNAILRRATREPDYDPANEVSDPAEKLAIQLSHPHWLIQRWVETFGFDETRALARANNEAAPIAFRLTRKGMDSEGSSQLIQELESSGNKLQRSRIAPEAWRVNPAGHAKKPGAANALLQQFAAEGLIYFQDEASQLVANLLGAQAGDRVLDVAAAPGSKTTSIAALQPEALVVAADLHEHRIRILRDLSEIQGARVDLLVVHDATTDLPFALASFDRVLVDAPCSGTGTLRHNPEIRWRLKSDDIAELALKQRRILANAAAMVRPGGLLLYSTCSVELDENEEVVADFIRGHAEFAPASLSGSSNLLTETGAIRTWPHRHDVDGFFIKAFQRRV
ncbi:MAG: 16S rRNA (cytosine(967)-C(5))-methyltransferase RsmB [Acidobacteriota bacterium]